jgi:hypothetical protein
MATQRGLSIFIARREEPYRYCIPQLTRAVR